jgi:N-acetylglucosaminyldiphosphoundecaprenol N-acetyl-beta-D-mannosaminyltransferase
MTDALPTDTQQPVAPQVDVLGVCVSVVSPADAVTAIDGWVRRGERRYVCVANVHSVMEAYRHPALREVLNGAALTTPDGMPLVWLLRHAGYRNASRVYGPDLLLAVCARSAVTKQRHFFLGGAEGVADAMVDHLRNRFPGLHVAGTMSPPFRSLTPEEDDQLVESINRVGADVVWVGLGAPKQERWMAEHRSRLDAPVLVGVGAAFDFHAGTVPQAPARLQRMGLEWGYRLLQEPRRLAHRYLLYNPWFVVLVVQQQWRTRRKRRKSATVPRWRRCR